MIRMGKKKILILTFVIVTFDSKFLVNVIRYQMLLIVAPPACLELVNSVTASSPSARDLVLES